MCLVNLCLLKKTKKQLFSASFLKIKVLFIVAHDEHLTLCFLPHQEIPPFCYLSLMLSIITWVVAILIILQMLQYFKKKNCNHWCAAVTFQSCLCFYLLVRWAIVCFFCAGIMKSTKKNLEPKQMLKYLIYSWPNCTINLLKQTFPLSLLF